MNAINNYDSPIPTEAKERVRTRHTNGAKCLCDYQINGIVVGRRSFDLDGHIETEYGLRGGKQHGNAYRFYEEGALLCREPYENGVLHGTAYQWAENGRLLGTYTLQHGTGIDLWWEDRSDSTAALSEVHHMQEGQAHGFEWWLNADGRTLWIERHWRHGVRHGIEREWNHKGRMGRTYPRFWLNGRRVTRARYLRAAADDRSLPAYQSTDNVPLREFPADVALHIGTHHLNDIKPDADRPCI